MSITWTYSYRIPDSETVTICQKSGLHIRVAWLPVPSVVPEDQIKFAELLSRKYIHEQVQKYLMNVYRSDKKIATEICKMMNPQDTLFLNRINGCDQVMIRDQNGFFKENSWKVFFM